MELNSQVHRPPSLPCRRSPFKSRLSALLLVCCALIPTRTAFGHPLKLSASLIEHHPRQKTLRVECKVFADDFDYSLFTSVLKGVDRTKLTSKEKTLAIEEYFKRFYAIRVNGKTVPLKLASTEMLHSHNVLVIRFKETPLSIKKGDRFVIRNILFFKDFGAAQTNRITVRIPLFGIDEGLIANVVENAFPYTLGEMNQ